METNFPSEFDVIISSTGLVESIVGAALAWQGTKVLQLDSKPYYGGDWASLNIDQLKDWVSNINKLDQIGDKKQPFSNAKIYISRVLDSKQYSIDISPHILFANSDFLDLLRISRVYKYLQFKPLGSFHTFQNDSFDKIPSTKEAVFTSQTLTLVEKRSLMKFMKFVIDYKSQPEIWESYKDKPIEKFLSKKFKLGKQQSHELIYALGLCTSYSTSTDKALSRIKRYLTSLNIFGNFPAMFSMYGSSGEISQGFCRSGAVGGAIYKLGTSITNIDEKNKFVNFSDGTKTSFTEKVVTPSITRGTKEILRLTVIVGKCCREWFAEDEHSAVVVFPPGSIGNNTIAVQCLIYGPGSGLVPRDQSIWYLSTTETGNKGKQELELALKKLEDSILRESTEDFDIEVNEGDVFRNNTGELLVSSLKLGQSLKDFVPKEKLQILLKLQYIQHNCIVNPILLEDEQISNSQAKSIIYSPSPLFELSYDGIVSAAKLIFAQITGSDDDFFDVDFEDEDEEQTSRSNWEVELNNNTNDQTEIFGEESMEM